MTLEEFETDDRFATIDDTDIACHGGTGPRCKRVYTVARWLLDPENGVGFVAVLDPADMHVATLECGCYVVWTPLDEFEA